MRFGLLMAVTIVFASAQQPSHIGAEAERYIRDSESQWAEAVANGDVSAVQQILSDDFIGVDAGDGHLYPKAEAISWIQQHHTEYHFDHLDDMKVRFFGNIAVAQGSESWERRTGEPRKGRFVWTDTWVLRNGQWQVHCRWAKGEDGKTKTEASDGYVPLHAVPAHFLPEWRAQTPYAAAEDFVFPSLRAEGHVPLSASIFVADHLRPAAKKAGICIKDGQRLGLHNLRHSLSNWLVNKAKIEPKTVQGILRHAKIQTTLDLYTQEDSDETRAAQGEYLMALGVSTNTVQ